jgi:hypothetical protein
VRWGNANEYREYLASIELRLGIIEWYAKQRAVREHQLVRTVDLHPGRGAVGRTEYGCAGARREEPRDKEIDDMLRVHAVRTMAILVGAVVFACVLTDCGSSPAGSPPSAAQSSSATAYLPSTSVPATAAALPTMPTCSLLTSAQIATILGPTPTAAGVPSSNGTQTTQCSWSQPNMNFASVRIDLNSDQGAPLSCGSDQSVNGSDWTGCFAASMDELLVDKGAYTIEIFAEFSVGSAPTSLESGEEEAMTSVVSDIDA